MSGPSSAEGAPGAGRFHTLGILGEGGNGVVFRALDLTLGAEVALKVLTRTSARDRFRFKREFRALSEVVHPNLVRLYELFAEGDEWYLSMELIQGTPLDVYLARDRGERLRAAFVQLADAVTAIHASGKVHRDLKPSNVLVEPGGRVVVLDYGLIADTSSMSVERTHDMLAVGTPAYMSPEQATDAPLTAATDWYAVGAMLYKALTGVRPFEGPASDILQRRVLQDPPPPSSLAADTPPDLDAICMRLLDRDPDTRADGRDLLLVLGAAPSPATLAIEAASHAPPFVGRAVELDALGYALELAHGGQSVVMTVTGPSGIGKTALLRQFVERLDPATTLAFHGRCYERETMPYQAIDSLIDAVATMLLAEPAERLASLLPRDAQALARLFPTLERVRSLAAPRLPGSMPPDRSELRRRAIAALAELLANLAGRRTPVFFLDDLQWSDADSGAIVTELIHRFDGNGALFLIAARSSSDVDLGSMLATDRAAPTVRLPTDGALASRGPVVRELALGAMSSGDAHALFRAMAGGDAAGAVDEAGGVPLLVAELARSPGAGALDRIFHQRIDRLPAQARTLLELAAISTRPLRLDTASLVIGGDPSAALAILRTERLVRVDRRDRQQLLEPAHERVRNAAIDRFDAAGLADQHRRLAGVLETRPDTLATDLVAHWLAAGDRARAARHARRAAAAAEQSLAFHRAAELYRLALAAPDLDGPGRRALLVRIADCLARVGRLDAAMAALAEAHATLGPDASAHDRRDLRRLEIEYALRTGDYGRGLEEARALMAELGLSIPRRPAAIIAAVAWQSLRLRMRGTQFTAATTIAPADRERIDVLWSLTAGLAYVNPAVGRLAQLQHLRASLDAGDADAATRALCLEISNQAHDGEAGRAAIEKVAARCRELIDARARPDLHGIYCASYAVASALLGAWQPALEHAREAEQLLRDSASDTRWGLAIAMFYRVMAAWYTGDTAEVIRLVPRYVAEAEQSGDAHVLGGMRTGRGSVYWLIVDRPVDGRMMAEAGLPRRNPGDPFNLHDFFHAYADAQLDLYEGAPGKAGDRVEAIGERFAGSLLRRVQLTRIDAALLRARCALARAGAGWDRKHWLGIAGELCDDVEGERASWSVPLVSLVRGGIAHVQGDAARAIATCERAAVEARERGMLLHARAARHRLGECQGGDAGAALIEAAAAELRAGGVVAPTRLLRVLAPGW